LCFCLLFVFCFFIFVFAFVLVFFRVRDIRRKRQVKKEVPYRWGSRGGTFFFVASVKP
jgi:hypothetical protein